MKFSIPAWGQPCGMENYNFHRMKMFLLLHHVSHDLGAFTIFYCVVLCVLLYSIVMCRSLKISLPIVCS